MKRISGCPVNPPIKTSTAAVPASSCVDGWTVGWPVLFMNVPRIVIARLSNRARKCAVKARLLFSFDLHHSGVVNDNFHRAESNAFEREQDCSLDSLI